MELLPSHLLCAGEPVPLLTCRMPCPRPMRPLACRLFPLGPFVKGDRLTVRMDLRARPLCPLYSSGIAGLSPAFVSAVKSALRLLWADPVHREYLCLLTEHLKEYDLSLIHISLNWRMSSPAAKSRRAASSRAPSSCPG